MYSTELYIYSATYSEYVWIKYFSLIQSLQDTSPEFTNDVALMDYNFAKNRYNNILPCK